MSATGICDESCNSCLGVFKQGESVSLFHFCATCTYVNISSIVYPNSTVLPLETAMTKDGSSYTYDFVHPNLPLGDYSYNVIEDKGGNLTGESLCFVISSSGVRERSVLDNTILLILFGLAIVLLVLALYLNQSTLGFMGAILFILSGIYVMVYGFNGITNFYARGAAVTVIAMGLFFMFVSAYEWINNKDR
jgi:hypothetical protein